MAVKFNNTINLSPGIEYPENLTTKKQCGLIEAIIHDHLPTNMVMRTEVLKWLSENYTKWKLTAGGKS